MDYAAQVVESEERFRSLFENNPDLVIFQEANGIILDANSAFLAALHKAKTEVLHRPFSDFLPPAVAPLFQQKLREAFEGNKVRFVAAVQFDGAEPKVLDVTKVPLMEAGAVRGVYMVARDITEATAAQNTIQQQARKLSTIFESITDAFFLLDHEWRFAYVNNELERMIDVTRAELLGRNMWELFPEGVGSVFQRQYEQAVATGQAVHFEALLERLQLWLDVKAFPSEEGLSVYFADISDRVKARKELYRQNQDLQQFTYIVSHNLRAPLANVLGLVDLLASLDANSMDFYTTLGHLHANAHQLDAVFQDMNTILAIRDARNVAATEHVLLADIVEQAHRTLQEPLQQYGGTLHVDLPAGLRVRGNRAFLYSIFFNLLSNSIKYRAEARPLRVEVQGSETPEHNIRISFADNGSGFDLDKAGPDVFKLYKRFHPQHPGRGIGLYLVRMHVEAMNGRVEVHSRVDVGTQFIIHLS